MIEIFNFIQKYSIENVAPNMDAKIYIYRYTRVIMFPDTIIRHHQTRDRIFNPLKNHAQS